MEAFKAPLTFDIGCPSSLASSFVIEIQKYARRIEHERICETRRKLDRFTTVVAYTSVTLKPLLHKLSTEPGVCMRILIFTPS